MGQAQQSLIQCNTFPTCDVVVEVCAEGPADGIAYVRGVHLGESVLSDVAGVEEETMPLRAAGSEAFGEEAETYTVGNEYIVVSSAGAKGRAEPQRTSNILGILAPGTVVLLLEVREVADDRSVQHDYLRAKARPLTGSFKHDVWLSPKTEKGKRILVLATQKHDGECTIEFALRSAAAR